MSETLRRPYEELHAENQRLQADREMCIRTLREIEDPFGPDPGELARETLDALGADA